MLCCSHPSCCGSSAGPFLACCGMIYSVWSYQNNGVVLWQKKNKKLGGASSSSPTRQPPALHPPTHQHPQPSILEAEKLLCASLALSKCTVFLENYSRKFASQLGDAARPSLLRNMPLCFWGRCSCLWRVFELFDLSECLLCSKVVVFVINTFSLSSRLLENDKNQHHLTVFEGKLGPLSVS